MAQRQVWARLSTSPAGEEQRFDLPASATVCDLLRAAAGPGTPLVLPRAVGARAGALAASVDGTGESLGNRTPVADLPAGAVVLLRVRPAADDVAPVLLSQTGLSAGAERPFKYIADPVHGQMRFEASLVEVIDTPEFQRLRNLQQLGAVSWVWPGAVHTRFAHSLGVAHLAGKVICHIARSQPELGVTPRDCLLIQLAGLCHDLGHGPFSHSFEEVARRALAERGRGEAWSHEDASEMLFDAAVRRTSLDLSDAERRLVKAMIRGVGGLTPIEADVGPSQGSAVAWAGTVRPMGRPLFFFQIVANRQTGMDVDKYDYLSRDAFYCGTKISFDPQRLLKPVVREHLGERVLAYYRKEEPLVSKVFSSRCDMHSEVYQHSAVVAVTSMFQDVLWLARGWLDIAAAITIPEKYVQLDDAIIGRIAALDADAPPPGFPRADLVRAQALIRRVTDRKLYWSVALDVKVPGEHCAEARQAGLPRGRSEARAFVAARLIDEEPGLAAYEHGRDYVVWVGERDWTQRERNPVLCVPFYSDRLGVENADTIDCSQRGCYWERCVRAYVCITGAGAEALRSLLQSAMRFVTGVRPTSRRRARRSGGGGEGLLSQPAAAAEEDDERSPSPARATGRVSRSASPGRAGSAAGAEPTPPRDDGSEDEGDVFGGPPPPSAKRQRKT